MKRGFTLLELVIVIFIIGILSTFGIAQYRSAHEQALDREAQVNLRLILAAERVWRMEDNNNPPRYTVCIPNTTLGCNNTLRLIIPAGANAQWNYRVNIQAVGGNPAQQFAAQATRTRAPVRWWCIRQPTVAIPDPQPTAGACPF